MTLIGKLWNEDCLEKKPKGFQKGNKLPRFTGKKHSEETKKKMSEQKKINNPMFNEETCKKVSKTRIRLGLGRGEKSGNWKGGITPENNKIRNNIRYKRWRLKVFKRDKYTCRTCGEKSSKNNTIYITAHHIKQFAKYPKLRYLVSNGLTLCIKCHSKLTSHEMLKNHKGHRVYANNRYDR